MLSVSYMGESVGALSWLYGRVSRCSQLHGCMGESVGALSWLYGRVGIDALRECAGESVGALSSVGCQGVSVYGCSQLVVYES